MISLPTDNSPIVLDSEDNSHMETGDITVPLTLAEHELMLEIVSNAVDYLDFIVPSTYDLPENCEVLQRYDMINNLRERLLILWTDRFTN
jgi:hypothetical protein